MEMAKTIASEERMTKFHHELITSRPIRKMVHYVMTLDQWKEVVKFLEDEPINDQKYDALWLARKFHNNGLDLKTTNTQNKELRLYFSSLWDDLIMTLRQEDPVKAAQGVEHLLTFPLNKEVLERLNLMKRIIKVWVDSGKGGFGESIKN